MPVAFTDLVNDLNYPDMGRDAQDVIKNLTYSKYNKYKGLQVVNVRIMPHRTLDDRIDGLVITFTDITASKKSRRNITKGK
jgi:two-component system CheB/CheR fusion protein